MSMNCMNCTGYQDSQDYIIVDNIEDATHWLAQQDSQSYVREYIIPNKAYELIKTLNFELQKQGFLTINGKIPLNYLLNRLNIQ